MAHDKISILQFYLQITIEGEKKNENENCVGGKKYKQKKSCLQEKGNA